MTATLAADARPLDIRNVALGGGLEGRATSDPSGKSLKVTRRKRKRVTRLSGAERQRRWRQRHREAHKAQQREYMRRKRRTQREADALDATARRHREDQELQERVAAANKARREREARKTEAFRLAKAAGLGMEAWLELPDAENPDRPGRASFYRPGPLVQKRPRRCGSNSPGGAAMTFWESSRSAQARAATGADPVRGI